MLVTQRLLAAQSSHAPSPPNGERFPRVTRGRYLLFSPPRESHCSLRSHVVSLLLISVLRDAVWASFSGIRHANKLQALGAPLASPVSLSLSLASFISVRCVVLHALLCRSRCRSA